MRSKHKIIEKSAITKTDWNMTQWRNIFWKRKYFFNQKKIFYWLMWRIFSKSFGFVKALPVETFLWETTKKKLIYSSWHNSYLKKQLFKKNYKKDFHKRSVNVINYYWSKSARRALKTAEVAEWLKETDLRDWLHEELEDEIKTSPLASTVFKNDVSRIEMSLLKQTYNDKLSPFFYQPWKKLTVPLPLTGKQHWLNDQYSQYQTLRFKDRIDFFRTYIGQILGSGYWKQDNYWTEDEDLDLKEKIYYFDKVKDFPLRRSYFKFYTCHRMGWWYNNLAKKKKRPLSANRFILDRPKTAFQIHWAQQKLEPWKDSLLFKRALYAGYHEDYRKENKLKLLKIKPYLRSKNPRQEKRHRLYSNANYLLNNFFKRFRIRRDKMARIKQVTGKILRPFYGHLRIKQIKIIVKKSKKKKSKNLTYNEVILSHFERRLDVVVYRMNLAPTILWARRLIKAGLIFVISEENRFFWESMYGGLKNLAFPLKLRDPKNLYKKTYWDWGNEDGVEFKFLGQPKKKISYLLQPGDLIQCAAGSMLNDFKTKFWLYKKPTPKHLIINKKPIWHWHWHHQKFKQQIFKNWEQDSEPVSEAIFLYSPRYRDFNPKDRLKESFLRWAMI